MEDKSAKPLVNLFNPKKIKSNSNIHIIGKRASGKTVLVNKLLKEVVHEDDCGIIVGPCEVYLKEYIKKHANSKCFYKFTEKDYEQVSDHIGNSTNNSKFIVIENGNADMASAQLKKIDTSYLSEGMLTPTYIRYQYLYEVMKGLGFVFKNKNIVGYDTS